MKQNHILLLISFTAIFFFNSCNKESLSAEKEFDVKYVYSACSYQLFEIQDPNFTNLGEPWGQYKSVFDVKNVCDLPGGLTIGNTYRCKLIDAPIAQDTCVFCMIGIINEPVERLVKITK
jgi:hypothetical protein